MRESTREAFPVTEIRCAPYCAQVSLKRSDLMASFRNLSFLSEGRLEPMLCSRQHSSTPVLTEQLLSCKEGEGAG